MVPSGRPAWATSWRSQLTPASRATARPGAASRHPGVLEQDEVGSRSRTMWRPLDLDLADVRIEVGSARDVDADVGAMGVPRSPRRPVVGRSTGPITRRARAASSRALPNRARLPCVGRPSRVSTTTRGPRSRQSLRDQHRSASHAAPWPSSSTTSPPIRRAGAGATRARGPRSDWRRPPRSIQIGQRPTSTALDLLGGDDVAERWVARAIRRAGQRSRRRGATPRRPARRRRSGGVRAEASVGHSMVWTPDTTGRPSELASAPRACPRCHHGQRAGDDDIGRLGLEGRGQHPRRADEVRPGDGLVAHGDQAVGAHRQRDPQALDATAGAHRTRRPRPPRRGVRAAGAPPRWRTGPAG